MDLSRVPKSRVPCQKNMQFNFGQLLNKTRTMKNDILTNKVLTAFMLAVLISIAGMKQVSAQIQNYPVAILQHNDSIRVFYGSNAFVEANAAASNGDTITLSGGDFNGCTVSKSIVIHGAGCVMDSVAGIAPTKITDLTMLEYYASEMLTSFKMEGVWITGYLTYHCDSAYFEKCNFNSIRPSCYGFLHNSYFRDCIIGNGYSRTISGYGITFSNCVLNLDGYYQSDRYNPNAIVNSVVLLNNGTNLENSLVVNSIIKTADNNSHANSSFFNCIAIKKGNTSIFEDQNYSTNMEVNDYEDVFETFDGTVTYDNLYQLKEEIVNTFPGNDGTQVGIYGGANPYDTHPLYMIMKHCNVAGSTDNNHKLSVEIELNANGE